MSRRRMPLRAARNSPTVSPNTTRNQPRRESARTPGNFTYSEDTESSVSEGDEVPSIQIPSIREPSPSQSSSNRNRPTQLSERAVMPSRRRLRSQTETTERGSSQRIRSRNHSSKRRKLLTGIGRPRKANVQPGVKAAGQALICPPWPLGLPYSILLSIFQYAAYPLHDEDFIPRPSRNWLIQVALLRREFAEPALSALYYAPPLFPPDRARRMIQSLQSQSEASFMDYRSKLRYLDIEAPSILFKKYGGNEPLHLKELIEVAPRIRGIEIHFPEDSPKNKALPLSRIDGSHSARIYSAEVLDTLDSLGCPLHHWKWNYHVKPLWEYPWLDLPAIHSRPSFQKLRSLEICRFMGSMRYAPADSPNAEALFNALAMLPSLTSLTFLRCFRLDRPERFENIKSLRKLAFVDCADLDSGDLSLILESCGQSLQELTLNHNEALDLAFMEGLSRYCPSLKSIDLDLTLHSNLLLVSAPGPKFATLLPGSNTPTWPHTLRRISLLQLRKWNAESAETFFQSLANAAPHLPYLRELIIKASLEIDWRDRIKFRDVWVHRIQNIFLQESAPPKRHGKLPELKQPRVGDGRATSVSAAEKGREETRSKLRHRGSPPVAGKVDDQPQEAKTHGGCRVVDIWIDNLRPTEVQFNEADFMDDEPSGDEDWDGDGDGADDGYAW